MQARHCLSLFMLSVTVGLANTAWAYPEYRVTVMAPANSRATDINNAGVVVGTYQFSATFTHAFLNRGRGLVDLGTLRGKASEAAAINDKGQVLGHWTPPAGKRRGFIYYRGTLRDIGYLPGRVTTYTDINNAGFITAYGYFDSAYKPQGFLVPPDGTPRNIGALPFANPITNAYAINNRNQIAGSSGPMEFPEQPLHAFIWSKDTMRDLGDFGFAPNEAKAINDRGEATGFMALAPDFHNRRAFLYSNGRLIAIDGRDGTVQYFSEGYGINNRGHVVGYSNRLGGGFVYRGRRMQSLNALIDRSQGWDIYYAQAINDAGQIAATASRNGVQYAVRLDLIRPLAEPVPDLASGDEAAPLAAGQEDAKAQAKADAEAEASEVVQAVEQ